MKEFHEERNLVTRPADKGRYIVVLGKSDYVKKVMSLLRDTET